MCVRWREREVQGFRVVCCVWREGTQDGRSEVWRHTTYFTARAELSPRAADATEKSSDMVAVAL